MPETVLRQNGMGAIIDLADANPDILDIATQQNAQAALDVLLMRYPELAKLMR